MLSKIQGCFLWHQNMSQEPMADVSDTTVGSDIFVDDVETVVKAIKESKKHPDTKGIWQ